MCVCVRVCVCVCVCVCHCCITGRACHVSSPHLYRQSPQSRHILLHLINHYREFSAVCDLAAVGGFSALGACGACNACSALGACGACSALGALGGRLVGSPAQLFGVPLQQGLRGGEGRGGGEKRKRHEDGLLSVCVLERNILRYLHNSQVTGMLQIQRFQAASLNHQLLRDIILPVAALYGFVHKQRLQRGYPSSFRESSKHGYDKQSGAQVPLHVSNVLHNRSTPDTNNQSSCFEAAIAKEVPLESIVQEPLKTNHMEFNISLTIVLNIQH